MFSHKNNLILLSVFLIFLFLGIIRSQDAFKNDYSTFAFSGDGHGTIADFSGYNKSIYEDGFWQLLVDRWYPKFGGGYSAPKLMNIFWRLTVFSLSYLEPDNIYDVCVVLLFVLNGVSAYLLARYLKLNHYYSFLCAVFIVSLDNFDFRITGHLNLAAYFGFIIAIIFLFEATRNPTSLRNTLLLGIIIAFSFTTNEYYGLFVLEISVMYYFIIVWRKTNLILTLKNGIYCSSSFFVTLAFLYPFTFVGPLLSKLNISFSYPSRVIHKSEYLQYVLYNPLELFTSNFELLSSINHWIAKANYFPRNGGEFSYRIGFNIILIFSLFMILYIVLFGKIKFKNLLFKISPLLFLYFLTIIISIHPEHPFLGDLSLVNLHIEYGTGFRVNERAMTLGNVFLILIFGTVINEFSRNVINTYSQRLVKFILPPLMILAFFASIIDTRSEDFRPWDRWTVQPIPESVKFARKLRGLPKGMTMEIPYYSDNNIIVETTYIHGLNAAYHGNEIVNFMSGNSYRNVGLQWWSREVNNPNIKTIEKIRESGIKYIIVWKNPEKLPMGQNVIFNPDFYRNAFGLKKIFTAEIGDIFEVIGVKKFDHEAFGKFINNTPSQGKYSHQIMSVLSQDSRTLEANNNLKFVLTESDINKSILSRPNEVFDKGNYQFSFRFEKAFFNNNDDYCLKLEIISKEAGPLSETYFTQSNLEKIGRQIDFDIFLNSVSTLEFNVVPMCLGEIVFSEIAFKKKVPTT